MFIQKKLYIGYERLTVSQSYSFTKRIGEASCPIIGFWFDFMLERSHLGGSSVNAHGKFPKFLKLAYVRCLFSTEVLRNLDISGVFSKREVGLLVRSWHSICNLRSSLWHPNNGIVVFWSESHGVEGTSAVLKDLPILHFLLLLLNIR
mgnify:CR=1 FL=1